VPMQAGEVYDQALVTKDRNVPLGKPIPPEQPEPKAKAKKAKA